MSKRSLATTYLIRLFGVITINGGKREIDDWEMELDEKNTT